MLAHPAPVADLGAGAKGPWPPPLQDNAPTSRANLDYLSWLLRPANPRWAARPWPRAAHVGVICILSHALRQAPRNRTIAYLLTNTMH